MKLMTWTPRVGDRVTINKRTLTLSVDDKHIPEDREYVVIGKAKGPSEFWVQDTVTGRLPVVDRKGRTAGFTPRELIKVESR